MSKSVFYRHKIENLINVERLVTIHYYEFTKDFKFEGESHDFWEIVYVDSGQVLCSRDGKSFILKQGTLTFHKPNEFHTIMADGIKAPNVFVMCFVCRSEAMSFFNEKSFLLNDKLKIYIKEIIDEAENTFDLPKFNPNLKKLEKLSSPNLGGQQLIRISLEQLLIKLMRVESNKISSKEIFLSPNKIGIYFADAVIDYLQRNIYNNINLNDVCKAFNYGKTFLCTRFKLATGKSVMEFYNNLKLTEAKKLIREKNLNFKQISELLHFDSPSHFTHFFKKSTNKSPREYLKTLTYEKNKAKI